MNDAEKINRIEELKSRASNAQGIFFSRIPKREWEWFRKYAEEEWCNDYGLAFKSIIAGIIPPETEAFTVLEDHELRLKRLEEDILLLRNPPAPDDDRKEIKMANGRTVARRV